MSGIFSHFHVQICKIINDKILMGRLTYHIMEYLNGLSNEFKNNNHIKNMSIYYKNFIY